MTALLAGAALVCVDGAALAKLWNFSFSGLDDSAVHGWGILTTDDSDFPYTIIDATGRIYDGQNSTGAAITGVSDFAGADMGLSLPAEPFVSFAGFSVSTAAAGDFNFFYYSDAGTYGLISSLQNDIGAVSGVYSPISLDVSPVPELSTWAMLGLGFAGLGFVALRRRRTEVSTSA